LITGSTLALGGMLASSFTTNILAFVLLYAILGGVGCGTNYLIPLVVSWEHFPERKGMITGIIIGSYGLGSFIFTRVSTHLVNPDNLKASVSLN